MYTIITEFSSILQYNMAVAVFSYIGHCDYDNDDVNPPTLKNSNKLIYYIVYRLQDDSFNPIDKRFYKYFFYKYLFNIFEKEKLYFL